MPSALILIAYPLKFFNSAIVKLATDTSFIIQHLIYMHPH
ncbi:hypothetical protein PULV_b0856 [Pseudoalteromonas ulvae UL12]|nr:hypothetical protein [Pseudoalteromonas ulvae UL12]